MALTFDRLTQENAACVYRNINHRIQDSTSPYGKRADEAWKQVKLPSADDFSTLKQWLEKYLTDDQWMLFYEYCLSTIGKGGQLLDVHAKRAPVIK